MNRIGLSKRMLDALADEGLTLTKRIEQDGIIYEGLFYTGIDYEKTVNIDLRNYKPETKRRADEIACVELRDAYDNYSVGDRMRMYLNAQDGGLQGVPEPDALLADLKEEESRLERFADVADAVCRRIPIPPAPEEAIWRDSRCVSFYAIQSARATNLWWRIYDGTPEAAVCDTESDVREAARFNSPGLAKRFIKIASAKDGIVPGKIVRIEQETITRVYEIDKKERSRRHEH